MAEDDTKESVPIQTPKTKKEDIPTHNNHTMKKILILAVIFIIMPFATFAHGAIDDGDTTTHAQDSMMADSDSTMSGAGDHAGGAMSGGMMGGNMMWMNVLHMLLGVTSLVWLIAGILFLYQQFPRQTKTDVINQ